MYLKYHLSTYPCSRSRAVIARLSWRQQLLLAVATFGLKVVAMGMVVLLVGPKAVGKSWVAETLEEALGVHYIDADLLILDLLESGEHPHKKYGWLTWVEAAISDELIGNDLVSIEATGEWESDYLLADNL